MPKKKLQPITLNRNPFDKLMMTKLLILTSIAFFAIIMGLVSIAPAMAGSIGCEPEGDDQVDTDRDGVCDASDICQGSDDTVDSDGDGVPDGCDVCEGDDSTGDSDGDLVCNDIDVCEGNDSTGDSDGDLVCDDIDVCEGDDASGDTDSDSVCDDTDNCVDVSNPFQEDDDSNGVGDACSIDVVKTWTHTDYNWGLVCDIPESTLVGDRCFVDQEDVGPARQANIDNNGENSDPDDDVLADPLLQDDTPKYLVHAQVNQRNDKFQNTNPGAFYALTTVVLSSDVAELHVEEDYSECFTDEGEYTEGDMDMLKFVSKKPTRNVKVAVADSNGDVTELTDLLYDIPGAIVAGSSGAMIWIEDETHLTEGSTVYVLVKFQDALKGFDTGDGDFDDMCMNTETVTPVIDETDQPVVAASADLRITNDIDEDGVLDKADNCPFVANAGQEDADGDGVGDDCDACPGVDDNADVDQDGLACFEDDDDGDACNPDPQNENCVD